MPTETLPEGGRTPTVANPAAQFALLIDSVREYAIYMLDARGIICTWNSGGQRIKGYRPEEILGRHYRVMFSPEDQRERKPERLLERAAADGSYREEGWRVRKDGSRFWASVVITAIRGQDGALLGFAKVVRDESERHDIEDARRRHSQELERAVEQRTRELAAQAASLRQANEDLEQFNHVISHDLQEPIRMVSMYTQKLLRRDAATPEQRERWMGYVQEGAERMRLLIEDLRQFSSIEREPPPAEPVDSAAALQAALDNLRQLVAGRGVEIRRGRLPRVRGSMALLTQVFQNLVENGIKYGPESGAIIEVGARPADGSELFSVRDNGIGIEAQHHERIFGVFQRLHGRDRYPGTGMGLAICKKIVERNGGRIWVDSAPGQGSTFHFTVPAVG